ncbi:ArsR/SmtB family transcription factor [Ectobacillus ponti]|uniref:Metalloregulator ArsR/SmtB family transcription factor n=1 Tax=Ectobacillus ponti TaxID=2961894 RepID=A0AA41X7I6_9BACI|nr:metalloregulator ArsR/SmtB family transcription factor [Ectobacillus ponti]MCP8967718.1 metalloregulator ArsR/SmtB family transcription factor [Ectobacillus ponti]
MHTYQQIDEKGASQYAELLKLIAHPVRLRMLELVMQCGSISVKEMCEALGLPQPVISQHTTKMKKSRVLKAERKQLEVLYQVEDPRVRQIIALMQS